MNFAGITDGMETFIQQLLNAVQMGGIYALLALGYTMVYGVLRLINFAHGAIFMASAFIGLYLSVNVRLPFMLTLLGTMAFTAILGVGVERVAYRPLRAKGAPTTSLLITALGVGLFLENFTRATIGASAHRFPPLIAAVTWSVGGVTFTNLQAIIIVTSLSLMLILRQFIRKSLTGKAMRAVADQPEVLGLMGIDQDRLIMATFIIGSALAAAGGILFTQAYPVVEPYMGTMIGWKSFIAAVLGGIGLVDGAVVGGLILGAMEVLVAAYLPSTYRDGIAFAVLIMVLLMRPTGLLGRPAIRKV